MFYFYFFEFLLRFYHAHLIWPSLIVDNSLLFMNSRSILECFNSTVPNATLLLLSSILAPPFLTRQSRHYYYFIVRMLFESICMYIRQGSIRETESLENIQQEICFEGSIFLSCGTWLNCLYDADTFVSGSQK